MMFLSFAIAAILAVAGAFILELPGLLVLAAAGSLFYWMLLAFDLRACLASFERLSPSGGKKKGPAVRSLTGCGQGLLNQIEALQYRLHRLAAEDLKTDIPQAGQTGGLDTPEDPPDSGESELTRQLKRTLERIMQRHRCRAASIVLPHSQIISCGEDNQRLQRQLIQLLEPFFAGGSREMFGLQDGQLSRSMLGDFSSFGVRYSICLPFSRQQRGAAAGCLWLGYSAERPPLQTELLAVQEWIPALEAQLSAFHKIRELGERGAGADTFDREKAEVIACMSHDIRSPLSNIKAVLNLLKLENLGSGNEEFIEVALKNCESMQEIIEDLLDYARHRMGRLSAQREYFCLKELALETVKSYRLAARQKGLQLGFSVRGERFLLHADRAQMRRVLSNLVSNAIKYTAYGSVEVVLLEEQSGSLELVVKDSGAGMSARQIQGLFAPFTRFHPSAAEGIGLGLALSKVLVELNNGRLSVKSQEGRGSEFCICLPKAAVKMHTGFFTAVLPESEPLPPKRLAGRRILLVDDDGDCVDALARILEAQGAHALRAIKEADAESIINFDCPDLIISDGNMPGGGALRIVEFLKCRGLSVPVFVVSGNEGAPGKSPAPGVSHVFTKPVDVNELLDAAAQALAAAPLKVSSQGRGVEEYQRGNPALFGAGGR